MVKKTSKLKDQKVVEQYSSSLEVALNTFPIYYKIDGILIAIMPLLQTFIGNIAI